VRPQIGNVCCNLASICTTRGPQPLDGFSRLQRNDHHPRTFPTGRAAPQRGHHHHTLTSILHHALNLTTVVPLLTTRRWRTWPGEILRRQTLPVPLRLVATHREIALKSGGLLIPYGRSSVAPQHSSSRNNRNGVDVAPAGAAPVVAETTVPPSAHVANSAAPKRRTMISAPTGQWALGKTIGAAAWARSKLRKIWNLESR